MGLLIVLLLYIHEMGHIIAAWLRRMPIRQGPTFIPGLGAFVLVEESTSPVDSLFLYLGGPLVGALGALLLYWVGVRTGNPQITWTARWGLWLNLVNLLPLLPFDGGRVIRWTGRIGLIAGLVAAVVIAFLTKLVGGLLGLGLSTTWRAIKRARYETPLPLGQRLAVLSAYLLTGALLYLPLRLIPETPLPPRKVIPAIQPLSWAALAYCALYLVSLLPVPWAIKRQPWLRYCLLLLFGWPRLLLQPWRLLLVVRLFIATLGPNQWGRLQVELRRRALQVEPGTGEAAAWVYDAFARTNGRPHADAWWAELMPALLSAGPSLIADLHRALEQVGQGEAAAELRTQILSQSWDPVTLDPTLAQSLARQLHREGRHADALPFARRSIQYDDAGAATELGRLYLTVGELVEAEWAYRMALDQKRSPGVILGLGEVLARQGRYAEARRLGDEALQKRVTDVWNQDEPTAEEIQASLTRWQEEAHLHGEP